MSSVTRFVSQRLEVVAIAVPLVLSVAGCSKSKDDGAAATAEEAEPESAGVPEAEREPVAAGEGAEEGCVRPGAYEVSSKGPFYLLDEGGKLPPPAERKQKVDEIQDCSVHASLKETFTVEMAEGEPEVTFAEDTLGDLEVSDAQVSGCRLSFSVTNRGEPWMIDRARFELDFSGGEVKGQARDVYFQVKLDGEMGENMVSCGADDAELTVASAPVK